MTISDVSNQVDAIKWLKNYISLRPNINLVELSHLAVELSNEFDKLERSYELGVPRTQSTANRIIGLYFLIRHIVNAIDHLKITNKISENTYEMEVLSEN